MRILFKILKWLGILLLLIIVGLFITIKLRWNRKFDAPFPALTAVTDSAMIARGEYLIYGPAHCAVCHGTEESFEKLKTGERPALSGGFEFKVGPLGKVYSPNITSDKETGIGRH